MASAAMRLSSGAWTNSANGFNTQSRSSSAISSPTQVNGFRKSSSINQTSKSSLVNDSATALKRKSATELGAGVSSSVGETTFIKLVEWIRSERLSSLPHQGSTWDTVLVRALHVSERLHKFEASIQGFTSGSNAAAKLAYSHIRLLLELGHENSSALDKAFGLFYKCSLVVSSLLDRTELLSATSEIQQQLCMMYSDLVTLVVEVAIYFYKSVQAMDSSASSVSLDMYEVFGETLQTYNARRDKISDSIWQSQIETLGNEYEEVIPIDVLSRWLAPQDRVLDMFGSDHTVFADDLAEFTGIWFQESLTNFIKGTDECLLINGPPGSGKTTLAAAIMERLQRPVARKAHQSVFVTIGAVPAQTNSLHLVKSILHQLLSNRIGNLKLYTILVRAHQEAQETADPQAYENHLWTALGDALQHPLDSANPTVLVIDGLDEIEGNQAAGQKLLERLTVAVGRGKKTKLIAFSQSLTLPSSARGQQRQISPDDTRDDIHAVAIRALARSPIFVQKPGPEQETIIASILDASRGSFTWSILLCECLRSEKNPEAFGKTLATAKSSPPSVADLVLKLLTSLQPALESCLILAWLTVAARPLTFDELSSLLAVNVEKGEMTNPSAHIHGIVDSVRPLLSITHDVVRTRHSQITDALQAPLQSLIHQGKIPLSHKNCQIDLLMRCLIYTKTSLPDNSAPTLEMSDSSLPARLFPRYPLLEYVIRYWPYHFNQTPFTPGESGSPKLPEDFKRAFPDSTAMPILEWLCWDEQFPGSQEVKLHYSGCRLRSDIFSENHPTVMQGYINCALYYGPMGNDKETTKSYFSATLIGQVVLKPSHPATVGCANRYLKYSSNMTTTTRTEVMTQRERVLQILIVAYERQFGASSELVTSTRQRLIELYQYIKEEENANKLLQKVHEDNVSHDTSSPSSPRGVNGHLHAQLRKSSTKEGLKSYDSLLFADEDEEDETDRLDLDTVVARLKAAKSLTSQKKFEEAETTYVNLWRQLSTICRSTLSSEWHERKIETVNAYAETLATSNRKTQSSAILVSLAEEYQKHELSYAESIVSRLTQSARILTSVGYYAAALSIFQQSASYYQSTRKEQSRELTQIEEMIAVTSTEVTKQATSSSESGSAQVSKSSLQSVFQSLISNRARKVDASTMSLATQLVIQYMERMQYEEAATVIQTTLQRTWSSFITESVHSVTLPPSLLQENLALLESLAQAYIHSRMLEKAMDVYLRLYRATLASPQQYPELFEKAKRQLIEVYDKYGYTDRSIAVLQEVLPVYTRIYGANNETTVVLLYDLGARCRHHARTHPYWVEYYQQIVKATTKDSKVSGNKALEAVKIVATSYWEERRYTDASAAYGLIWATLVDKPKPSFNQDDAGYLQTLYQQYRQCLEATQASSDTLYRVSKQYRDACIAAFGANAAMTVAATTTFAQICQSNEKYESEALTLLEQASKQTSSSSSSESREIRKQLSQIYHRRITQSSNVSSEILSKSRELHQEQLSESHSKYGYTSEVTLNNLREVAMLDFRQGKSEAAMKQITTAVVELNTKEISQEQVTQSATSIASIFQASQQTSQATELLQELRSQVVAHEKRANSRFQFDLTESSNTALVFLATLEYQLRKDLSLTQSDIFTDLLSERLYYNNFQKVIKARNPLDKILISAAPLRHYLLKHDRKQQVQSLEQQVVSLFIQRDLASFTLEAKNTSPKIFIVGILDYLGARKNVNFVRAVILATNKTLRGLVDNNKFAEAYDIANIGFKYAKVHNGYRGAGAISSGFALASYLDGRGENRCPDETLRKKLLQLSNLIVKEILSIAREQDINLAQVQLTELNELIALLGEQGDWETLESLLSALWNTKKAQQTWPSEVLLRLGSRLIAARYLAGHPVKAIRLCEDIAYNLRRTHGQNDPATLEVYRQLIQLYTSTGQTYQKTAASDKTAASLARDYFKKAVLLEEDILRRFISEAANGESGEGDDEEDTAAAILAEHGVHVNGVHLSNGNGQVDRSSEIKQHMRLLKLSYQRFGQWPKPFSVYEQLNANVYRLYGNELKGVEGVEKWQIKGFGGGKAESAEGAFEPPKQWDIVVA